MAVELDIEYTGALHCDAFHRPSGKKLSTDAPVDNGGKGEDFSPTDLVAAGLGACVLTIIALEGRKRGIELSGMKAHVVKDMISAPRRRIGRLTLVITIPYWTTFDRTLRDALASAVDLCPVKESLRPEIELVIRIEEGG